MKSSTMWLVVGVVAFVVLTKKTPEEERAEAIKENFAKARANFPMWLGGRR